MITTHLLDLNYGRPAARVPVELDVFISGHGWRHLASNFTNDEGRVEDFGEPAAQGVYRLVFDIASYMPRAFFPSVALTFEVHDPEEHYHVPLLLSSFGYTTYRGS